jgi:hypothetical protein
MARYRIRYVTYAAEQLCQLPRLLRIAFDAKVDNLERDPYVIGEHDEDTLWYSTTFSGGDEEGIILYMISPEILMITVLRVFWVKL